MKNIDSANGFADRIVEMHPENFSRDALVKLFEHIRQIESVTGIEIEFDPVTLCTSWLELTEGELHRIYGNRFNLSDCEGVGDIAEALEGATTVIPVYKHGINEDTLLIDDRRLSE